MLTQVRGALKGVGAWFIVVLLILAFALWGVPELRTITQNSALKVGQESFSGLYIQNEFTRQINLLRQQSGGEFTRAEALASGMPAEIISSLASASALKQSATGMGLTLPREFIRDFLQQNTQFQNRATGQFDRTVLERILRDNNMSVNEFERRIGEEILRNQLISALTGSGPAPKALTDAMMLRLTERRKIAYLTITNEMSGIPEEPMPDILQTYYQENPTPFTAPEYRTFSVSILLPESFRKDLEAPEDELRRLYEAQKARLYDTPERRTLYQITFDSESEARAGAATLREGKPFENIAIEQGVTLEAATLTDALPGDVLNPGVREAAFSSDTAIGDILDPVENIFGWTVVQIAGISPPETKTFEEVRDELENDYLTNDTRRKILDTIDTIEEERDTGAGLAAAAQTADAPIERFGPVDSFSFAPGNAIISGVPGEVLIEAFRLEEGEESEALPLASGDGYFFVSLEEITAPALIAYDDVSDEVDQRWRRDERQRRIADTVRGVREAVEAGQTLEEAATAFARAPIEETINRNQSNDAISTALRDEIFQAPVGNLVSGEAATGDAQIIAHIREVGFGRNAVSALEVAQFQQNLGYQLDQEMLEAFVSGLREDYGVTVNQAQIDALFTDG